MRLVKDLPEIFEQFSEQKRESFLEVKKYKEAGKPVIGAYCSYFPRELAMAVGAIPVGLCSSSNDTVVIAEQTLPANICPLIKSSYGAAVSDACPYTYFADLIVGETSCDGKKKMYELLSRFKNVYVLQLPQGADRSYAQALGVDVDNLLISQPDNGEQALEIADSLIRSSAIDIIVIDSVAALTPKAEIEGDMGESKMGLQARLMSQALRKLTASISKTKTVCIFINQLRDKIGVMFGNPETTTGGNALKFYASVRVDVRRTSQIKDGEEALGNRTRVKIVKNKLAPPFKKAEFDIVFGEGISHVGEIIDLGVELDIIRKSGSWFSYNDAKLAQGREAVKQLLTDNVELCDEIEARIREALKSVQD